MGSFTTRIKVTGVTTPEDAEMAAACGVDMVACVLNPASQRYVTSERVWEIRRALRGRALLVGVFADVPELIVQRLLDHCQFDAAQLFGSEPRSSVEALIPYAFKAVSVSSEAEAEHAVRVYGARRASASDLPAVLLSLSDGAPPVVAASAARRVPLVVAAGNLDERQIDAAIRLVRPWGVDTWEAVETSPGHLDRARLEAFVAAVRHVDASDSHGR